MSKRSTRPLLSHHKRNKNPGNRGKVTGMDKVRCESVWNQRKTSHSKNSYVFSNVLVRLENAPSKDYQVFLFE